MSIFFDTNKNQRAFIINDKWRFRSQVRQSNLKMALIDFSQLNYEGDMVIVNLTFRPYTCVV